MVVSSGFGLLQVAQQVELALRTYLWPVPPGGPAKQGWPLGRTVRSLELDVIVSQVAGVVEVNGLVLCTPTSNGGCQALTPDASGNTEIAIPDWQLPELLQVLVTTGTDGSGVQPGDLSPTVPTDNTVAVPVVPAVGPVDGDSNGVNFWMLEPGAVTGSPQPAHPALRGSRECPGKSEIRSSRW